MGRQLAVLKGNQVRLIGEVLNPSNIKSTFDPVILNLTESEFFANKILFSSLVVFL
jgi:hypothetical protein